MARIGIGVPVRNGADYLAESLEALRTQTFEDIEVLIGDNGSGDATPEICADFAARDSRFRHVRRAENLGALANFQDLRRRSTAEYFCWRAHDDLSAPNFLEELAAVHGRKPEIGLALAEVRAIADDRPRPRVFAWRDPPVGRRTLQIKAQIFTSHLSWIYGLWHRETLGRLQDRVLADYPHRWGADHLTILPLILQRRIGGTNRTHFVKRIFRCGLTRAQRRAKTPGEGEMRTLRADFDRVARAIIDEQEFSEAERHRLLAVLPRYVDEHAYKRSTLWAHRLRRRLGIGPRSG